MTASFDRALIDPDPATLTASLHEAIAAVNRDMPPSPQILPCQPAHAEDLSRQMRDAREGALEWRIPGPGPNGVRAALVAVWWSDFLGRRHLRLLGGCRHRGMELPAPIPSPHRPALSCVYPSVCVIASEHRRSRLLAVCDCGASGSPESLAWMGTMCGPCHDRDEPPHRRAVLPAAATVTCLAFTPDGRRLAFWDEEGTVALWDVDDSAAPLRSWYSTSYPGKLAFSRDGEALACQARTRRMWVYDVAGDGVKASVARAFAFAPEQGELLIQQAPDGDIVLCAIGDYDQADQPRLVTVESVIRMPYPIECRDIALSPDSRIVAVAAGTQGLCFWDAFNGEARSRADVADCGGPLAWSPDGTLVACGVGSRFWKAVLWDYTTWQRRAVIGGADPLSALAFTPDGQYLVTAEQNTLRTWQTRDGQERRSLTLIAGTHVISLAVSADGRTVALGMAAGGVRLWPVEMLLPEG